MIAVDDEIKIYDHAMDTDEDRLLSQRWKRLKYHREQQRLWNDTITGGVRFVVVPAGRRSGKTEFAKRFIVVKALMCTLPDGWFVCGAPTRDQAKRLYWKDLKALIPNGLIAKISESHLVITLVTGVEIQVMGMEKAERVEGRPLDGIILDEYANMRENIWKDNIRPALSTIGRPGWAWFIGVPEGRNHYYRLARRAQGKKIKDWGYYHWSAADILDPDELEALKQDLDPFTYQQEIEGSFLNFQGRAYYPFTAETHANESFSYMPEKDLVFCFDFNIKPGIAGVLQEQPYTGKDKNVSKNITVGIGEVWIPENSNTERVCDKLIQDWRHHKGRVLLYGDATGGAGGSAKVSGSDWDIIMRKLKPIFPGRVRMRVPKANPAVRARINAVNSRFMTVDKKIHFKIDPSKCPFMVTDFEGVTVLEGGAGELNKDGDPTLTHMSDGIGYYIFRKHPIAGGKLIIRDM